MIKVLRIIARLNIGGPAINAVLLSDGLDKCGFATRLVTGRPDDNEGDMSYLAWQKGVRPIVVGALRRRLSLINDIKAFCGIYRIIKNQRPDIVHTHTAKAGALGRLAAAAAGVPVRVHTFHGHVFDGYFNRVESRLYVIIERLLAGLTDKIIAVSNSVANDITKKYNIISSDKLAVIRLGLDLERFFDSDSRRDCLRKELGLKHDVFLIGIVGRLVSVKNHRMFLDVAKRLSTINYQLSTKFIIVGDGELRGDLEDYAARLGIKAECLFLGWRRDLEDIYAGLDIVCLTSLNEGTPVSLIEAMAAARPVVATDVGAVKDIVKDGVTGRLAASCDSEGFARAVGELMDDQPLRRAMGASGREFARLNFDKGRLISETSALYKELLRQKGLL